MKHPKRSSLPRLCLVTCIWGNKITLKDSGSRCTIDLDVQLSYNSKMKGKSSLQLLTDAWGLW